VANSVTQFSTFTTLLPRVMLRPLIVPPCHHYASLRTKSFPVTASIRFANFFNEGTDVPRS